MGIGGALAAARDEAGLTVDQVSERTRIRRAIISAIEQDDYSPCGGDYYARGHIRAIARVVGTDPAPLIEEYDVTRGLRKAPHLEPGEGDPARTVTIGRTANGRPDKAAQRTRQAGITAAEAFRPGLPLQTRGSRRHPVRAGILVIVVAALIAGVAWVLASQNPSRAPAALSHSGASARPHATPTAPASSQPSPTPAPTPLQVTSAEAFGPAGPGQGDNPGGASLAIDGNPSTAWHTDWYGLANVNGKPGTGLLLDMGSAVTVASVQLQLGPAAGGTVQLRAGNTPALASLPVVAQAATPDGALTLQGAAPVSARYVLIWFTQLPPNGSGRFQAFVYNVSVSGTA